MAQHLPPLPEHEDMKQQANNASDSVTAVWEFQDKDVRMKIDDSGKEWFQGVDVCGILGYRNHNDTLENKVRKVYKTSLGALCEIHIEDDLYSENRVACISEPGLYQFIFPSRLEFADKPRSCHLMHDPVHYLSRCIQNRSS